MLLEHDAVLLDIHSDIYSKVIFRMICVPLFNTRYYISCLKTAGHKSLNYLFSAKMIF
jgi:hypothetical protein